MDKKLWLLTGVGIAGVAAFLAVKRFLGAANEPREYDPVQESSEGSFPASDPPSWTPVGGPGEYT